MSPVLRALRTELAPSSREDGLDIVGVEFLSIALPTSRVDQDFDPLFPLRFTVGPVKQFGDPGDCTMEMQFVDYVANGGNSYNFFRGGMRVSNVDLVLLEFCPQDIEERDCPGGLALWDNFRICRRKDLASTGGLTCGDQTTATT